MANGSTAVRIAEAPEPVQEAPAGQGSDEGVSKDFIITALVEENARLNQDKIMLSATVKQMQAQFQEARAVWAAERDSLSKGSKAGE